MIRTGAPARRAPTSRTRAARAPIRQPAGRRSRSFMALFAMIAVLNGVGLTMILSASSVSSMAETGSPWYQFTRQALWFVAGLIGLVVALRIDYRSWRRWAGAFYVLAVALLVALFVPGIGREVNGARRWIGVGVVQLQPSEIAKLALLLAVSDLLARRSHLMGDTRVTLRPVLVMFATVGALVMFQPNLGTTVLIFAIVFVMLFVAGTPGVYLALLAGAGVAAALLLSILAPYRMARMTCFADPWADQLDCGYQPIQSQVALNHGGVVGTGFGQGRAKYGFLPEADTDFIFSVVGEETGFLGTSVVVALFLGLGAVAVKVALNAPDRFGLLVATGIATWILVQAFVNIGVAVGILPNTGVPLPFVSAGGSSLLVTMIASGILLNISRHTP
jgi:cell division protein FtsW